MKIRKLEEQKNRMTISNLFFSAISVWVNMPFCLSHEALDVGEAVSHAISASLRPGLSRRRK